ncbi:GNAT family N-acetyltransferase [Microvirga pudoricolor]|uniref:GNAT family N-acetyltransferase n=1 Tax=Microvirga pudoricolor TaxID=2778729 RepID=UPI001951C00A|nr:GNAT family N-acetyltransferase [Microvirga pudoricolor]MBM6593889.1 GNAT family N-acetyltransferase [Microvirga pudoricolor]
MSFLDWFRTPPGARLEALAPAHAPRVTRIHAAAFARPWDVPEFERLLGDRAVLADGFFLGASLCGFAISRVVLDEAEILTVAMAAEARGRGHARPLLAHHLDALVRRGARVVHLEVEDGNAPALALYRRLGFREAGRREGYYPRPDGTRAAALTMSLAL